LEYSHTESLSTKCYVCKQGRISKASCIKRDLINAENVAQLYQSHTVPLGLITIMALLKTSGNIILYRLYFQTNTGVSDVTIVNAIAQ